MNVSFRYEHQLKCAPTIIKAVDIRRGIHITTTLTLVGDCRCGGECCLARGDAGSMLLRRRVRR